MLQPDTKNFLRTESKVRWLGSPEFTLELFHFSAQMTEGILASTVEKNPRMILPKFNDYLKYTIDIVSGYCQHWKIVYSCVISTDFLVKWKYFCPENRSHSYKKPTVIPSFRATNDRRTKMWYIYRETYEVYNIF